MKYSLGFILTLLALSASAQPTAGEKTDSECAAKVATYIDGLQNGYEQVKTDVAKQRLDAAKLVQKNMTPCAAEDYFFSHTKAALKVGDEAVADKSKN
jgi:hypothetical protein